MIKNCGLLKSALKQTISTRKFENIIINIENIVLINIVNLIDFAIFLLEGLLDIMDKKTIEIDPKITPTGSCINLKE